MERESVRLKHSFVLSVVGIMLTLLLITGSTYAWFTLSGMASTNVTPMGGTVSSGDTVLYIGIEKTGPFDKTCELKLEDDPDALQPVSTIDLEHFYEGTAQTKEGITVLYQDVTEKAGDYVMHGTVYLQCLYAPCNVYFNREELELGAETQMLEAMRLGMKITTAEGTEFLIFKLDDLGGAGNVNSAQTTERTGVVVSGIAENGIPVYENDPAAAIGSYMAQNAGSENEYKPGASMLMSLQADEVAAVEYWLYLEGCDEQCINEVQKIDSEVKLAFAGVASDVE